MAYTEYSFSAHLEDMRGITYQADAVGGESSEDRYLRGRNEDTGNLRDTTNWIVGQHYHSGDQYMQVWRAMLLFSTSALPDDAVIEYAALELNYNYDESAADFDIVVQNGQPTYPSHPPVYGDYDLDHYSGDGGSLTTVGLAKPATLEFNETGISWIQKEAGILTKLVLRSSRDITPTEPSGREYVMFARPTLVVRVTTPSITTEAVSNITYDYALGNGTIVGGEDITERGFEVRLDYGAYKDSQDGSLGGYVFHSVAGFDGTVTWDLVYEWNGVLTKTITEENGFEAGAFTGDLAKQPYPMFNDTLFKCESYTCRAYMVAGGTTYYGEYVSFDTLCDAGEGQQPTDDISEGDPIIPPILIEDEPEWIFPEFIWELPEIEWPPWIWPDLPSWEFPDYPPMSFVGDFYYRKPYTKKDLDDLRRKCIIYNKNSIEYAMVLWHNMNVLREFFNMMTDYMETEEFNDFTDLIPPQRLKELYLDPLKLNDFRDMINGFIRNTVDNNIAVNRNFKLIGDGLSDYETESDDAHFKEINSNMKSVTEDNPDVHRLKRVIDNLNQEVSFSFRDIMHNLKIVRAKLL